MHGQVSLASSDPFGNILHLVFFIVRKSFQNFPRINRHTTAKKLYYLEIFYTGRHPTEPVEKRSCDGRGPVRRVKGIVSRDGFGF
jgi:hypothetical protein